MYHDIFPQMLSQQFVHQFVYRVHVTTYLRIIVPVLDEHDLTITGTSPREARCPPQPPLERKTKQRSENALGLPNVLHWQ
jgi:hypothetical protein